MSSAMTISRYRCRCCRRQSNTVLLGPAPELVVWRAGRELCSSYWDPFLGGPVRVTCRNFLECACLQCVLRDVQIGGHLRSFFDQTVEIAPALLGDCQLRVVEHAVAFGDALGSIHRVVD